MTKEQLAKLGIITETDLKDEEVVEKLLVIIKEKDDKNSDYKGMIDRYSSEISTLKKEKEARMTEEEKAKAHLEEIEQENANYKRTARIAEIKSSYLGLGYSDELAGKIAEAEIDGLPTVEFHKVHQEELLKKVKTDKVKETPQPTTNNDDTAKITKKDFLKMGYEARLKLYNENPELYAELNKK